MSHLDRLSALMERFELQVTMTDIDQANFIISRSTENAWPKQIVMMTRSQGAERTRYFNDVEFSARVSWGGINNPFFAALSDVVELTISEDGDARPLVDLLLEEHYQSRCGSGSVLRRLSEILIVRVLRVQIEQGATSTSLVGGLADKRLARAIVAIHDGPGNAWSNNELADISGLSVSRFAELFKEKVGETPAAYIRKWRLTLARQDIERGDRVQEVAHRYCYRSAEALNHAFKQAFGLSPRELKKVSIV